MDMINEGAHIARQQAQRDAGCAAGEYLTYRLGAEEYGVDIQQVQEIRSFEPPTRVPGAPHYVKGVVNLRGVIVPIVDLRLMLGCEAAEVTQSTVVIVLAIHKRVVGVVVDSVSDVIDLAASVIQPPPELGDAQGTEFITGVASVGDRMLMLVQMEDLLGATLGGVAQPS